MRDDLSEALKLMTDALLRELGTEVDLIFRYGSTLKGTTHRYSDLDVSYVPAHESTSYSITVTVADILIDLYPIHWPRLEEMAEFENMSATVLFDNQLIYQRSQAIAERFSGLATRLKSLLQPEARLEMLRKARLLFQRIGYDYYLLREQAAAGHQLTCLFQARTLLLTVFHCLAVCNQACIDTRKVEQVLALPLLPQDFAEMVKQTTSARRPSEILSACDALMAGTRKFLLAKQRQNQSVTKSYSEVFHAAYPELKADLQHAKLACERADMLNTGLMSVHHELMVHMAEAISGVQYSSFNPIADYEQNLTELGFPDLISLFAGSDFKGLGKQIQPFDEQLKRYLREHSVELNAFANVSKLQKYLKGEREDKKGET